jgi:hypothetical protein
MNKILRWSGICAIISAILVVPIFLIEYLLFFMPENTGLKVAQYILLVISLPVSVVVLLGYLIIAEKEKLGMLTRLVWMIITITFITVIFDTLGLFIAAEKLIALGIALTIANGVLAVLFGWNVRKIKKPGRIPGPLGTTYIIQGASMVTVLPYMIVAPFTGLITSILEARLFFARSHDAKTMPKVRSQQA